MTALQIASGSALGIVGCGGNAAHLSGDDGQAALAGGNSGTAPAGGINVGNGIGQIGAASAPVTVTITRPQVASTCGSGVRAREDSLGASWNVQISGAVNRASATLLDAVLTVEGPSTFVQHLQVDHPSIPLVDGAGSADQRKTGADVLTPSSSVCWDFCTQATWFLQLELDVGTASASNEFGCIRW